MNTRMGYITPYDSGLPNALEQGTKSEMANKSLDWLHHPYYLGGPQRFTTGDHIRDSP